MTTCTHCGGRSTLFLDPPCIDLLEQMLEQLPWLITELEVTRTRMDKLTSGTRHGSEPINPLNLGAMELAREAAATLLGWTDKFGCTKVNSPVYMAWWLGRHIDRIVRHEAAGDFFDEMASLIGDPDHPDSRPGRLLVAINRNEKSFIGLCSTTIGRDHDGNPVECSASLYALPGARLVDCPRCSQEIDAERLRAKCAVDRDLTTETKLLALLADLGEDIPRVTFYKWLKEGRVQIRGWVHDGQVYPHKTRHSDPRVFSISQVRHLRWQMLEEKVKTA